MKPTVLVVDDCRLSRAILADLLRDFGCEVRERASAVEINDLLASEPPDLVLMDVAMPGVTGDRKIRRLRGDARYRDLPVVLVSARSAEELDRLAVDCGADGYLCKPVAPVALERLLRRLLPGTVSPEPTA
ncbi:MAG: response regulator [Geothermobacteraceae bacterium]